MNKSTDIVTVNCLNCNKELTEVSQRRKFCNEACKMQFNRNKRKGFTVTLTPDSVTVNTGKHQDSVTVTDQAFIDDATKRGLVNWYVFGKEIHDRKCIWDGRLFETRLKLNKYCSPKCRDKAVDGFTGIK